MHDTPIEPMNPENVGEFDVWIFDARDLIISVVPHHAPWSAMTEEYTISRKRDIRRKN
jgi:hypothetical protein